MKNKLYLALAAALAVVIAYALFFRPSDENLIRQRLTELEAAVKSGASQSEVVARPLRVQKAFARIFTPRVRVDIPAIEAGDRPREELAAEVSGSEGSLQALDVTFSRVHLEIDPRAEPPRADVDALATVTGADLGGVTKRKSVYQVTFHLEKVQGEWRISRVAAASVG